MKSLIFTILTFLAFNVLGQAPKNGPYIDPLIERAVNEWVLDMKESDLRWKGTFHRFDSIVTINFPIPGVLGYCDKETKVVYISRNVIDDPFLVRMVVYHELGHCILGYEHTCDKLSIMNPSLNYFPEELYRLCWDILVEKYVEGDIGIPCPKIIFTLPPSNSNQSFPPKTHICPR